MKVRITLLALVVILVLPFAWIAMGDESALRIDDSAMARQDRCQDRQDKRENCTECYEEGADCRQQEVLEEFISSVRNGLENASTETIATNRDPTKGVRHH